MKWGGIMENSILFEVAASYFQQYMESSTWPFSYLFYGPTIPNEMLEVAKNGYASYDTNEERPILLEGDTIDENKKPIASKGLLITNKNIYFYLNSTYKGKKTIRCMPLSSIKSFALKQSFLYSTMIINGKSIATLDGLNSRFKEGRTIVEELVSLLIEELNKANITDSENKAKKFYDDVNIEPFSEIKRLKDLLDVHKIEEIEFNSRKRELLSMI